MFSGGSSGLSGSGMSDREIEILNDRILYERKKRIEVVKEINNLKAEIDRHVETNTFITKRFDENYEAYKTLKEQLAEKNYEIFKLKSKSSAWDRVVSIANDGTFLTSNMIKEIERQEIK